ncbi:holin superfamily II protein [Ralstonia phage vB_RsoP_BMB50]|uniref:Holin superfamily II protein n=1 Tax=Ralstonia phage vB_RsoP_BMB50 TaxID=2834269 RepID=A0A8E5NVH9_9CAUD|nr:holin superfamily II protein [Ralstonia phage vB_RsoP_BMB50]
MVNRELVAEVASEAAKAAPPLTHAGMHFWGYPIADWVSVIVAVYTVVQLYFLLRKNFKEK